MHPVFVDLQYLEAGTEPELLTGDAQTVSDLPAARVPGGDLVSRWKPSASDLITLNAGGSLYVFQRTGGRPFQPLSVVVGP